MNRFTQRFVDALSVLFRNRRVKWVRPSNDVALPVYDDITNVEEPVTGTRVHLTGTNQLPAGDWEYHDGEWYSGHRMKTAAVSEDVGSQNTKTLARFAMPTDMEIDIWQAQVDVLSDSGQDVTMELYDETADTIKFSHSFSNYNNEVRFGSPIDTLQAPSGNDMVFRIANNSPGTETISGWLLWSFQEIL